MNLRPNSACSDINWLSRHMMLKFFQLVKAEAKKEVAWNDRKQKHPSKHERRARRTRDDKRKEKFKKIRRIINARSANWLELLPAANLDCPKSFKAKGDDANTIEFGVNIDNGTSTLIVYVKGDKAIVRYRRPLGNK